MRNVSVYHSCMHATCVVRWGVSSISFVGNQSHGVLASARIRSKCFHDTVRACWQLESEVTICKDELGCVLYPLTRVLYPYTRVLYPYTRVLYPYTRVLCPYTRVLYPYTRVLCPYTRVLCPYTRVLCPLTLARMRSSLDVTPCLCRCGARAIGNLACLAHAYENSCCGRT